MFLEVEDDRARKFGRRKVDGHVQNSVPAITNRKRSQTGLCDRAISRAESYYPPRMIVGATGLAIDWAPMRLVVPFVEQVRGW